MKTLKYDKRVYKIARLALGFCPICRMDAYDKRYKNEKPIASCNIYRTSDTSITMNCKQCGLYFTVTWKSLARAMGEKADELAKEYEVSLSKGEEDAEKMDEYMAISAAIETLANNVNIEGTLRGK